MKNKIGWCNLTFNPAWGCRNKCEYCYARKIASFRYDVIADKEYKFLYWNYGVGQFFQGEFANRLRHFVPTFIESNFYKKLPKKPQRIFVGSMSEIAHWEQKWMVDVIHKIEQYPQHIFQFLTRYPEIYRKYEFPENCWLGITATTNQMLYNMDFNINIKRIKFISIEPILQEIVPELIEFLKVNWIIMGAETGNRKNKIIPKKEWIENIINYCKRDKIPIYLKDSLKDIYPVKIKEFPVGD